MRRSRQVILMTLLALMSVQCSSGKGDDKAQPRVLVEDRTEMARYRETTSTTSTTTTVKTTTTTTVPPTTVPVQHTSATFKPVQVEYGSGACGGDLPPCWIMMRESRGNIHAKNPSSSASGKWQILDSTWQGYGGYAHASDAPEWVQDAKARSMALCNWEPPNYCG